MPGQLELDLIIACGWCGNDDHEECDHDSEGRCINCGESEGDHDRSCTIAYEAWSSRVYDEAKAIRKGC